jgi:hypothetical protein
MKILLRIVGFLIGLGVAGFFWWYTDLEVETPLCTATQMEQDGTMVHRPRPWWQQYKDDNYNLMLDDGTVCKVR